MPIDFSQILKCFLVNNNARQKLVEAGRGGEKTRGDTKINSLLVSSGRFFSSPGVFFREPRGTTGVWTCHTNTQKKKR